MEWFARPFFTLWNIFNLRLKKRGHLEREEKAANRATHCPQKASFYSSVPIRRIRLYQAFLNRAFKLSPSLEFGDGDDRYSTLLKEAAHKYALSELDLEMMRLQYILADPTFRKQHQSKWAIEVINREEGEFYPSPWAIVRAVFSVRSSASSENLN